MVSPTRFKYLALAAVCSVLWCGCFPPGQRDQDEQKEPHFLAGRSRVNQMDYKGAIESFTKALEVNPRSAAAHFELGWLYEEKDPEPAAAIYHYEQYLKLRPDADNAGTVRQRVQGAKQELAKTVLPVSSAPSSQRELERLMEQNRHLSDELEKYRLRYGGLSTNASISVAAAQGERTALAPVTPAPPGDKPQAVVNPSRPVGAEAKATRWHKIQAGESPTSIARKYGVKVETLLAANPGLNPKRLQIGQNLKVPSS